jgi:hypothetical protein
VLINNFYYCDAIIDQMNKLKKTINSCDIQKLEDLALILFGVGKISFALALRNMNVGFLGFV